MVHHSETTDRCKYANIRTAKIVTNFEYLRTVIFVRHIFIYKLKMVFKS